MTQGDLAEPLYLLPSECVTVPFSNIEQMRMRTYKDGPNLSGDRQTDRLCGGRPIIKMRPPDDYVAAAR